MTLADKIKAVILANKNLRKLYLSPVDHRRLKDEWGESEMPSPIAAMEMRGVDIEARLDVPEGAVRGVIYGELA